MDGWRSSGGLSGVEAVIPQGKVNWLVQEIGHDDRRFRKM